MRSLVTIGFIAMIIAPSLAVAGPQTSVGISMGGSGTFAVPDQPNLTMREQTPASPAAQQPPALSSAPLAGAAPGTVSEPQDCVPSPPGTAAAICD